MKNYLLSYEYKEKDGCLVSIKTDTKTILVADTNEFSNVINSIKNKSHERYLKILFCQEL